MTASSDDLVFRALARMRPAAPDAIHSASVRARCHAALARQRRLGAGRVEARVARGRTMELAVVGGAALFYVSLVIREALAAPGGLWPL
jgi:hypothetical protein